MKRWAWVCAVLVGCAGGSDKDETGASDTGSPIEGGALALTDSYNYRYTNTIDIASVNVGSGANVRVEWSGVTRNLLGQTIDPTNDVKIVSLVWFRGKTEAEVEEAIAGDNLLQSDIGVFASFSNTAALTEASFSQFMILLTPFIPEDYFIHPDGAWLVSLTGADGRSIAAHFTEPVDGEPLDEVHLDNESTSVTFDADLHSQAALSLSPNELTHIDWSGLTLDGRGEPLALSKLDTLMVAAYGDMPVSEMEASFLQIDAIADHLWSTSVAGMLEADLSQATDSDGAAFPGFEAGRYVLALRCGTCVNPAPPFLMVVEVE